ncbi:hypothetical protein FisN_8Lh235 [Fistulifera solaris]|uniref:RanBP2-type domain-containing protein n=1 Tax=Fistulifera solaris TaxID=1519565 RepID=A0A1Z5JN62_FISSO|nr:hypothetical protein FisN_8Lh235 [Fistulifera solaris]|eukprot:GAX15463.1 hypothetical protein FisN_8Lh235 [Fistulifera solaris]
MNPRYNLQPSHWNSPAVNQRLIQSKAEEGGTLTPSTNAIVPRDSATNSEQKPLPSSTPGRRVVRARHTPSRFLSADIKVNNSALIAGERKLWKDLSEKTSFAKPRSDDVKHVGFVQGQIMPEANRLYNKRVMIKRPLLTEPDESKDENTSSPTAPQSKRTRISFNADAFYGRERDNHPPARNVHRNTHEPDGRSSIETEVPLKSISTDPIVLCEYKGYRDSRVAVYGDPMDDYKEIKKAASTAPKPVATEDESPPWECKICKHLNPHDESLCVKCKEPRSQKSAAKGWGNLFADQKDLWKCSNCSVLNKKDLVKCASCETEKQDGSSSIVNGRASIATKATSVASETTSAKFTFGAPSSEATASSGSQPFALGNASSEATSKTPSFSFGSTPVSASTPSKPPSFSFVSAPAPSKTSSQTPSFSFGNAAAAPSDSSSKPPSFSFGQAPAPSDISSKPPSFSFGQAPAPSDVTSKPPSFSCGQSTAPSEPQSKSEDEETSTSPLAAFVGTSNPTESLATPFAFGGTSATSESAAKSVKFEGSLDTKETSKNMLPSFGASSVNADTAAKSFAFGESSSTSDTPADSFSFGGAGNSAASASSQKPSFSFSPAAPSGSVSIPHTDSSDEKKLDLNEKDGLNLVAPPPAPFVFGSSQTGNGHTADTASFGNNGTSVAAPPPGQQGGIQPLKFGAAAEAQEDGDSSRKKTKSSFGFSGGNNLTSISEDSSAFGSVPPPKFGQDKDGAFSGNGPFAGPGSASESNSSGFVFGSSQTSLTSNANAPETPASFGQPFGTSSTYSGNFGATSVQSDTNTAVGNNVPNFGTSVSTSIGFGTSSNPTTFGNAAQAPATFGAPAPPAFGTSTPAFGAPAAFGSAPAPAFGNPASAPANTAPIFGAAPTPSSSAPAFGNPTFGAPNPFGSSAPAPMGFGMNPAPAPAAPTFGGFNPAPSFGQTGQAPSFGAPAVPPSFGQPPQQPSFSAPQGFGGQAPSFGASAGAADGGFSLGSGGAAPKRRTVRVRRK